MKALGKSTGNETATTPKEWNDWLDKKEKEEEKPLNAPCLSKRSPRWKKRSIRQKVLKATPSANKPRSATPHRPQSTSASSTASSSKTAPCMSCYIIIKRKDLDGNLTSVRVMHKNRSGEEVIEAHLISHIDEDYK